MSTARSPERGRDVRVRRQVVGTATTSIVVSCAFLALLYAPATRGTDAHWYVGSVARIGFVGFGATIAVALSRPLLRNAIRAITVSVAVLTVAATALLASVGEPGGYSIAIGYGYQAIFALLMFSMTLRPR